VEKHTCCSTSHETGESTAMEGERPARKRLDKIPEGEPNLFPQVVEGLKKIYQQKILPVELKYKFDEFHSPTLRSTDFDAKPMVLLLGQYSTGKTSFIEFMLDRPFPGSRIGPEPTTDRFVAVMHGDTDRVIPGNAVAVDADKPFHALNRYGASFLSKFEAAESTSPLLQHISFIDTPGVLSGEKQRIGRSYDFVSVVEWFAERADLILLLFDAHKLDISDEFKRTIESLKGNDDKIRVVLNKADMVSPQQLMRVYGAMMWSLGKVVRTPEVMRVYIGSFWNEPYQIADNAKLFDAEQTDLLKDLRGLPTNSAIRKVNEFVKRARLVKVHAYLISHLKKQMPSLWGGKQKKEELIKNMLEIYREVKRTFRLPPGDFPDLERFKESLKDHDFDTFAKMDEKLINRIDEVLGVDIPRLMAMITPPKSREESAQAGVPNPFGREDNNPFGDESTEDKFIIRAQERLEYESKFSALGPQGGKLSGAQVKAALMETGLPNQVLRKVWALSDIDEDGKLDLDEFCVALRLCDLSKMSPEDPIPFETLPTSLVPSSKADLIAQQNNPK